MRRPRAGESRPRRLCERMIYAPVPSICPFGMANSPSEKAESLVYSLWPPCVYCATAAVAQQASCLPEVSAQRNRIRGQGFAHAVDHAPRARVAFKGANNATESGRGL